MGAVMIHVVREEDIAAEFDLQMSIRAKQSGWFGKYPPTGWDLLYCRTIDHPKWHWGRRADLRLSHNQDTIKSNRAR